MEKAEILKRIADLLQKKLSLLHFIHAISKEQIGYDAEEQMDDIDRAIEKKQGFIDKIEGIDSKIKDYSQALKIKGYIDSIEELEDKDRLGVIKKLNQDVLRQLEKIQQLDKVNNDKLKASLSEVKNNIRKMQERKKADKTYQYQIPSIDGAFFDKKN